MDGGSRTGHTTVAEKHQFVDSHQVNAPAYYPPNGAVVSWSSQGENHSTRENGILSNSSYNHEQLAEPVARNNHNGVGVPYVGCTTISESEATQVGQGYTPYTNTDPYGYSSAGYANYYNNYQQQSNQYHHSSNNYQPPANQYQQPSNQSYPHPGGSHQNTGAPYQPLSSFQSTGSYAGPGSYSSSYYNPGDYQTGNYTTGAYSTQTNLWHGAQYATYNAPQYPNYTPESNSAYNLTSATAGSQYQQHYRQWGDYYDQTQTEVSCAPGTENTSVPGVQGATCSVSGGNSGHAASSNYPINAAYNPSWYPQSSSSDLSLVQPATTSGCVPEVCQKEGNSFFQNHVPNSAQPNIMKSQDVMPSYESFQSKQSSVFSQGSTTLNAASYQLPQSHQSFLTISQPHEPEKFSKATKLQIPNSPAIASKSSLGHPKTDKVSSITSSIVKPAYIGVSIQVPCGKAASHDEVDYVLKPGAFPKSLRGYVERALARCKNDVEKASSQDVMKEIISKATADGTLYTRDWDTEPLFPIPNIDRVKKEDPGFPVPTAAVPGNRKSPGRRAKSRWEPIPEVEPVEKSADSASKTAKFGGLNKEFHGGKAENKDAVSSKFPLSNQRSFFKNVLRPAKRQRLGDIRNAVDDGEASSDSDKDPLTKYSSAAIALEDSPEERKRRKNRSKRFDKGHGSRAEMKNVWGKDVGVGDSHARRASALMLSRNYDESGGAGSAVEDIDWDALIVKGTCQEIEKRYLRLTSAPDPATVRPEEVLEKALLMVQNSQRNYLYKCDQLKSIRQDLTVQHIRNELTVKVYETHARLAIEVGDLAEYNQCQSQLKALYAEGILGCHMEFAAYNLLCVILHSNNKRDLLSAMSRLTAEAKKDKAVTHALLVRSAVASGNYITFFRLYKTAPNLNTFLMDLYVEKMRYAALKCISRSYRPTVPVSYLSQILGFNRLLPTHEIIGEKEVDGVEECAEWLKAHGACLTLGDTGEVLLDAKASALSLYMPEPEDAVAHGDASLAVNDFLTRTDV